MAQYNYLFDVGLVDEHDKESLVYESIMLEVGNMDINIVLSSLSSSVLLLEDIGKYIMEMIVEVGYEMIKKKWIRRSNQRK